MSRLDFMASDRAYFKRHPKAEYRIRRVMPGEISDGLSGEVTCDGHSAEEAEKRREEIRATLSAHTHVVVRQLGPGLRARKFITLPPDLEGHKWTEDDARRFWEGWWLLPIHELPPPELCEWPIIPLATVVPLAPVVPLRGDKA